MSRLSSCFRRCRPRAHGWRRPPPVNSTTRRHLIPPSRLAMTSPGHIIPKFRTVSDTARIDLGRRGGQTSRPFAAMGWPKPVTASQLPQTDALRFLVDPLVPFSNNLAERDGRMMNLCQKISDGLGSENGANGFGVIRSVLSTARKQGCDVLQILICRPHADDRDTPCSLTSTAIPWLQPICRFS
jgi:hypothetical protein